MDSPKTVSTGLGDLVGNPKSSDMEFFIINENVTIPGHRNIVGCQSEMLSKFIYGTDVWPPTNPLKVNGISSKAFLELLKFIYTKTINLTKINALEIMGIAHYFELNELHLLCVNFLNKHIDQENVCLVFEKFFLINKNSDLSKKCIHFIQQHTLMFACNFDLFKINVDALKYILNLDELNISEMQLFSTMVEWATHVCEQNNLPKSKENKRNVIEDLLCLIRFPTMSENDFLESIILDVLNLQEIMHITLCIRNKNLDCTPYSNVPRTNHEYEINTNCYMLQSISQSYVFKNILNPIQETLYMSVNQPLLLQGISVLGNDMYQPQSLFMLQTKSPLVTTITETNLIRNIYEFKIMLNGPLKLLPKIEYVFNVLFKKTKQSYDYVIRDANTLPCVSTTNCTQSADIYFVDKNYTHRRATNIHYTFNA